MPEWCCLAVIKFWKYSLTIKCGFQVFLVEYAGPLIVYMLLYLRPAIVYGAGAANKPYAPVVQ